MMSRLSSLHPVTTASGLARRAASRRVVRSAAVPAAAHFLPSVLVLGQWWPPSAPPLRSLPAGLCRWRGPRTGRPEVALTFDDGPDPDDTPRVLDILDAHRMRGTFFLTGERVERYPGVVEEIVERGHEVGTHGYTHRHHLFSAAPLIVKDLEMAVAAHERLGARFRPRHFRPPYGQVAGGSVVAAHRLGLDMVLWSAWGREWADRSPDSAAARIIRRLQPGAIVLLHDSDSASRGGTAEVARAVLERVIEHLEHSHMTSVRVVDLLRR